MGHHVVPIYVFTRDSVHEVRGGGQLNGICGDIHRDVGPGEEFAGFAYDDLVDGRYAFDPTTCDLRRLAHQGARDLPEETS